MIKIIATCIFLKLLDQPNRELNYIVKSEKTLLTILEGSKIDDPRKLYFNFCLKIQYFLLSF